MYILLFCVCLCYNKCCSTSARRNHLCCELCTMINIQVTEVAVDLANSLEATAHSHPRGLTLLYQRMAENHETSSKSTIYFCRERTCFSTAPENGLNSNTFSVESWIVA